MTSSASSSVVADVAAPNPASAAQTDGQEALHALWLKILTLLSGQVERSKFITWFRDTAVLSCSNGVLVIGLPFPTAQANHLQHYRSLTLEAAKEADSTIKKLVYEVDLTLKNDTTRTVDLLAHFPERRSRKLPRKQEVKLAEGIISKILNPRYTLDNFVIGESNRLAHAACQAVASDPGGRYNPLFLYGNVGLGKTHLLQATGNAILQRQPNATVAYITSEDFTNEVVMAMNKRKMDQFRRRYRDVDVLIVDDVQFFAHKERTQEEFFHTFNTLYEARKQLIISADGPPKELKLEPRLLSRLERGMIADVQEPEYETRLAILMEKAREYELFLDAAVLQFIAEHATRNVRELEGILMQAVAQYELEQRMPTVKSISDIMRKLSNDGAKSASPDVGFEREAERKPTFQECLEQVSAYYSISVNDMIGASRVREILLPRQIAMYVGKHGLNLSFVSLGKIFSNRDHTTVMNAVRKIEKQLQNDAQLLREVRAIERELGVGV